MNQIKASCWQDTDWPLKMWHLSLFQVLHWGAAWCQSELFSEKRHWFLKNLQFMLLKERLRYKFSVAWLLKKNCEKNLLQLFLQQHSGHSSGKTKFWDTNYHSTLDEQLTCLKFLEQITTSCSVDVPQLCEGKEMTFSFIVFHYLCNFLYTNAHRLLLLY